MWESENVCTITSGWGFVICFYSPVVRFGTRSHSELCEQAVGCCYRCSVWYVVVPSTVRVLSVPGSSVKLEIRYSTTDKRIAYAKFVP